MDAFDAIAFDNGFDNYTPPSWLPAECPVLDWVKYRDEICVAVLNWGESTKRQKPILDLSYCMTTAMNECCWIHKNILWNPKEFSIDPFNESK